MRSRELLTAALIVGVASCSGLSRSEYYPRENSRTSNQMVGMLNYGHRGAEIVAETGDIAQGFKPVNGENYTIQDKQLIMDKEQQWNYAHLNFVAVSWDHDIREEYFPFFLSVLDETNSSTRAMVIDEIPSVKVQTQEEIDSDFAKFKTYSQNPEYQTSSNGKGDLLVFVHPFQLLDDADLVRKVANSADKYGLNVWMQEFPFYDTLTDSSRINWFLDYDPYAIPTGTFETDTAFTVVFAYHKAWDIKSLNMDYNRITQNLRQGLASGKELLIGVSDGEGAEGSAANKTVFQIYHNEISPTKADNSTLTFTSFENN